MTVDGGVAALDDEPAASLPSSRAAAWSPDGALLAVVDPSQGLRVVDFTTPATSSSRILDHSLTAIQHLQWSPKGTYLAVQSALKAESQDTNVQTWRHAADGSFSCDGSFQIPRVERHEAVFQWTSDERFCCRSLLDGSLQILVGTDLIQPPVATLPLEKRVQTFQFAPSYVLGHCLCAFTADSRDAMQRVAAPAEVALFRFSDQTPSIARTVPVQFGQEAEFKWSPFGTAVLAHCQTDIDDSGQSYYGGSKLVLISQLEQYTLDLTDSNDSVVQAVDWCPTRDEFVLIQGFQPARVTCWTWNPQTLACSLTTVLEERAHRNTIRWNRFGSMLCVAGFGNLAGQMVFFGRTDKGLSKISASEASCSVSAEWAPDGRHFMTASLAPRMRVDNCLNVWCSLRGTIVADLAFDELLEVQWRPEPPDSSRFPDISSAEMAHALSGAFTRAGAQGSERKQAYRPPTARLEGGSKVAMMMRGELDDQGSDAQRKEPKLKVDAVDNGSNRPLQGRGLEQKTLSSRQPVQGHGEKQPCPATGWEYMDPKGKKQGPFTLDQMQKWFSMGAFKADLPLRCDPSDRFTPLRELFPHPMVPFHRAPKRPI